MNLVPAVSQIWSLIFFPLSSMVLILKSMPIVEMKVVLKASSENLDKEKLFNPGLVSKSYFVNFVSTGSWLKI